VNAIVLGAGATGLAAAYLLASAGNNVRIIEAAPRAGGLLSSFEVEPGLKLETYYHHFFTHDAEINWMMSELGIADRILFEPTTMGVLRGGVIYPFNGPKDLLKFKAISLADRIRFGASSALLAYRARYSDVEDVPALEWFRQYAGRGATAAIWEPLMHCKFGEAAGRVPLAWMAGRLRQRARSRKGSEERLGYLRGSLDVLVQAWVDRLEQLGVTLQLGTRAERLIAEEGKVVGVEVNGQIQRADIVLSTLPTTALAPLTQPINAGYAADLSSISYLGAICVVLGMSEQLSPVYWLNVADPGYDFGGVIEQTNFIPPSEYAGLHITYLSRYMPVPSELWNMDDSTLVKRQIEQASRAFGRDVSRIVRKSWVFRARTAQALTEIGFWKKIPKFRSPIPNLFVASMAHIYPDERSVNNSIRVAAEVVREMGFTEQADRVPANMSLAAKFGH
jgi:protoporphyrinogen oxidase